MNTATATGRLTAQPTFGVKNNRPYTQFTLASKRDYKNTNGEYESDFISVVAFGKRAEFLSTLPKGSLIQVVGRLSTSTYTKQDGTTGYSTDVIVDRSQVLETKDTINQRRIAQNAQAQAQGNYQGQPMPQQMPNGYQGQLMSQQMPQQMSNGYVPNGYVPNGYQG